MVRLTKKVCAIAIFAALATVCISTNTFAADVEVNNYADFANAIANGDNIKLTGDITATSGAELTLDKPLTIDLNGHEFDANWAKFHVESDIVLDDTSSNKDGRVVPVYYVNVGKTSTATFTLKASLIENDYSTIQVYDNGKFIMDGGKVSFYDCAGSGVYMYEGSEFIMNEGEIVADCPAPASNHPYTQASVVVDKDSKFTINGGKITSPYKTAIALNEGAEITIEGGEIAAFSEAPNAGEEYNMGAISLEGKNSKATINGGKISSEYSMGIAAFADTEVVVNNGEITSFNQGITTNGTMDSTKPNYGNNAKITVNGGKITSIDSTGIYAPSVNGKTVINGGEITGKTGIEIRAGELEVKGGIITATASPNSATGNGNGTTTDGVAIAISQHNTKQNIKVTVCSGKMTGYLALGEANPQGNDNSDISKIALVIDEACGDEPEFISTNTANNADVIKIENFDIINKFVKGGRFSHRVPADFIADGYVEPNEKDNGMYYVTRPHDVIVNAAANGTVSVSKATAMKGDEVKITATPADGYELDAITVKDADGNAITISDGKFTMPAKDVTITVTFKEAPAEPTPAEPTKPEEKPENPATYDDVAIYFAIMGASLGGLASVAITKKFF
ncbi:hypothetical protein IKH79_01760 [Candidatus Saccharibacteria bacterium]|nr:hypothetical protein [Candidatus Saccharibacteria bacterium]